MSTRCVADLLVTSFNRWDLLERFFETAARQTVQNFHLIIADDGSPERSEAAVRALFSKVPGPVTYVWQPDLGYRRALILNRAIREARSDYLIATDQDCLLHPKFIQDHLHYRERGKQVWGLRACLHEGVEGETRLGLLRRLRWAANGQSYNRSRGFRSFPARVTHAGQPLGCNMGLWRADFERINGFDSALIGWGREDEEMAVRLLNAGVTCRYLYNRAIVYHQDHGDLDRSAVEDQVSAVWQSFEEGRERAPVGLAECAAPETVVWASE